MTQENSLEILGFKQPFDEKQFERKLKFILTLKVPQSLNDDSMIEIKIEYDFEMTSSREYAYVML